MTMERTYIMIKPDGVQRGLIAEIIGRFESRGYKLVGLKMEKPTLEKAQMHYADLSERSFFGGLCEFLSSSPVVAMCWEGHDVVKQGRRMIGETDPLKSAPGSIRGDFAIVVGKNIIHGSDSVESAEREIAMWFKEGELCDYESNSAKWIYE